MVLRRRLTNGGAPRRRGQTMLRGSFFDRFPKSMGLNWQPPTLYKQITGVHRFQRVVQLSDITSSATSDTWTHLGYSFNLAQIAAYSEITNLFDWYRISGVKLTFMPLQSEASIASSWAGIPTMVYVKDFNDASAPTSQTDLMQYPGVRTMRLSRPISIYIKPRCSQAVGGTTVIAKAEGKNGQWIDTSAVDVIHYGVKASILNNAPFRCLVFLKLYVEAKNPR